MDGGICRQHHPALGISRMTVPPRVHRTCAMGVGGGGHNQNWPRTGRIEAGWKQKERAAFIRPRIPTGGSVILEILLDRKLKVESAAGLNRLSPERRGRAGGCPEHR